MPPQPPGDSFSPHVNTVGRSCCQQVSCKHAAISWIVSCKVIVLAPYICLDLVRFSCSCQLQFRQRFFQDVGRRLSAPSVRLLSDNGRGILWIPGRSSMRLATVRGFIDWSRICESILSCLNLIMLAVVAGSHFSILQQQNDVEKIQSRVVESSRLTLVAYF